MSTGPSASPDTPTPPAGKKPRKRWYKRWWVWTLIGAFGVFFVIPTAIGMIFWPELQAYVAESSPTQSETPTPSPTRTAEKTATPTPTHTPKPSPTQTKTAAPKTEAPTEAPEETPKPKKGLTMPDVTGLPADEARDKLTEAGFKVTLVNPDETVISASNWDAVSTKPSAGSDVKKGAKVTVNVVRATERLAQESEAAQAERDKEAQEQANAPLDDVDAQNFCTRYAEAEYPYGIDMHWYLGKLAEEKTDTGWYMKVTADITNVFGAEQSGMNVECHMSGTNGSPVMDDFLAY